SFDGAIRGGRGARGGRDADVTTTISLRVESGLVTQAVLSTTGTITTPDGTSRDINRREATTFTDIGTVVLVTPTEVQALLESNVARATR
ncbi:MAG TPA: hypothetical protein VHF69_11060, partial [Candidatus Synoicihabitans sp.]|nr:hypothetical protein [Candidatus Synoicihabitans sp.]